MNELVNALASKGNSNVTDRKPWTADEVLLALKYRKERHSRTDIAEAVGHTVHSYQNLVLRLNAAAKEFAEKNGREMTNDDLVAYIKDRWGAGRKRGRIGTGGKKLPTVAEIKAAEAGEEIEA